MPFLKSHPSALGSADIAEYGTSLIRDWPQDKIGPRLLGGFTERNGPVLEASARARDNLSDLLQHAGVTLDSVVKLRPDGRGIYMVRNANLNRCVMKTSRLGDSGMAGLANLQIADLIRRWHAPIFPAVHAATADYTLEAYVPGQPLRKWMEGMDFDMGPLAAYLDGLAHWGAMPAPWSGRKYYAHRKRGRSCGPTFASA